MRTHEEYRDDLSLYAAGALTQNESEELKHHLAQCSTCREELTRLDQAAAQIALAIGPVAPSASLRNRLLAEIESPSAPVARRQEKRSSPARTAWFWAPAFAT